MLAPAVTRIFTSQPPRAGRYALAGFVALNLPFALLLIEWNLLGFRL